MHFRILPLLLEQELEERGVKVDSLHHKAKDTSVEANVLVAIPNFAFIVKHRATLLMFAAGNIDFPPIKEK